MLVRDGGALVAASRARASECFTVLLLWELAVSHSIS
jgi:hypothetical protein